MAAANQGDTDITLDGETVTLQCTLRASKEVNAFFGNFVDAYTRILKYDMAAFNAVVAAGLGKSPKDVEDKVFRSGMTDLRQPLSDYLGLLSNGGRPPEPVLTETKDDSGNA